MDADRMNLNKNAENNPDITPKRKRKMRNSPIPHSSSMSGPQLLPSWNNSTNETITLNGESIMCYDQGSQTDTDYVASELHQLNQKVALLNEQCKQLNEVIFSRSQPSHASYNRKERSGLSDISTKVINSHMKPNNDRIVLISKATSEIIDLDDNKESYEEYEVNDISNGTSSSNSPGTSIQFKTLSPRIPPIPPNETTHNTQSHHDRSTSHSPQSHRDYHTLHEAQSTPNDMNQNVELINMDGPSDKNIILGRNGTIVKKSVLEAVESQSASIVTRKLLMELFPRETLATHSLTGKASPAFLGSKPVKEKLNPSIVEDIIHYVSEECHVSGSLVRSCITTKLADENKMYRQRKSLAGKTSKVQTKNKENHVEKKISPQND